MDAREAREAGWDAMDDLRAENERLKADIQAQVRALERYARWVADCQSGMYVNCVYCGHRYGPKDEVPTSMADILKEHIEQCPEHPMSALKQLVEMLVGAVAEAVKVHLPAEASPWLLDEALAAAKAAGFVGREAGGG